MRTICIVVLAVFAAGCTGKPAEDKKAAVPSPAGPPAPSAHPSTKPVMAPYALGLEGPASVMPGQPFDLTATVKADMKIEGIRVRIELPAGAKLEGGALETVVAADAGKPAVVRFSVSVPDNRFYPFAVFATRPNEAAVASWNVGKAPELKPAGGAPIHETRDGKKVME